MHSMLVLKRSCTMLHTAGCWTDAVPNVHLGVCGYSAADSCGPDMAFARGLVHSGTARQVCLKLYLTLESGGACGRGELLIH